MIKLELCKGLWRMGMRKIAIRAPVRLQEHAFSAPVVPPLLTCFNEENCTFRCFKMPFQGSKNDIPVLVLVTCSQQQWAMAMKIGRFCF